MKPIFSLLFALFAVTASAETFTFKVLGIDCDGCAPRLQNLMAGSMPKARRLMIRRIALVALPGPAINPTACA